jgi:hypothetical protein
MGHWAGVQRADVAGLTFAQIVDLYEFATRNSSEGG